MDSQQLPARETAPRVPEVRHCSVCFAVINDVEVARRSPEGHFYCEQCGAGFFQKVQLRLLRTNCRSLEECQSKS